VKWVGTHRNALSSWAPYKLATIRRPTPVSCTNSCRCCQ